MMTLHSCSSDDLVAVTEKVETGLLRLPLELRQHIYGYIFSSPRLIDLSHVKLALDPHKRSIIYRPKSEKQREKWKNWLETQNHESHYDNVKRRLEENIYAWRFSGDYMDEWRTGILGVSSATSTEVLDVLYGHNVFVANIHGGGYHELLKFSVANLRRVRNLRIVARPEGTSYGKPLLFDPQFWLSQLWLPLLEGLLQFCIVAQQPLAARGYSGAPTLEQDLHEWTTWLDPILKCFSTNLPKTTIVSLDDDGCAETTAMMDKHFNTGYQKVKTITGDICFERGQYSRESIRVQRSRRKPGVMIPASWLTEQ